MTPQARHFYVPSTAELPNEWLRAKATSKTIPPSFHPSHNHSARPTTKQVDDFASRDSNFWGQAWAFFGSISLYLRAMIRNKTCSEYFLTVALAFGNHKAVHVPTSFRGLRRLRKAAFAEPSVFEPHLITRKRRIAEPGPVRSALVSFKERFS
jgi:hypothetical protein